MMKYLHNLRVDEKNENNNIFGVKKNLSVKIWQRDFLRYQLVSWQFSLVFIVSS